MSYDDQLEVYSQNSEKNVRLAKLYAENEDKGYHLLTRKNRQGQVKKVPCFGSGGQGTSIRNAITGERIFSHKVGSFSEDLYYKVMICTGESKHGDPITLFYESPEHYERHQFQSLDKETKKMWYERQISLGKRIKDIPSVVPSFINIK
jgi:hypothetical protein